jgi:hypothetical protein
MAVAGVVNAEINTGIGHTTKNNTKQAAPKDHAMYQPPASPSAQGQVLESIDGAGYTYLHLSAGGKDYWIAGTAVKVNKGDTVSYDENVVMHDFYSKTLKKSFDKIIFASHVSVVK